MNNSDIFSREIDKDIDGIYNYPFVISPGKEGSALGMIDSRLSTTNQFLGSLARQVGIIAIR